MAEPASCCLCVLGMVAGARVLGRAFGVWELGHPSSSLRYPSPHPEPQHGPTRARCPKLVPRLGHPTVPLYPPTIPTRYPGGHATVPTRSHCAPPKSPSPHSILGPSTPQSGDNGAPVTLGCPQAPLLHWAAQGVPRNSLRERSGLRMEGMRGVGPPWHPGCWRSEGW